jgi:hypothetical protein
MEVALNPMNPGVLLFKPRRFRKKKDVSRRREALDE